MKFTCLSRGGDFHFQPCHILNICGFRILFDCPVDLSTLSIFSPIPTSLEGSLNIGSTDEKGQKVEKPLCATNLIYSEPWYKTVKNLHLWNPFFLDVVLISSPMGILGLPFLTRVEGFHAKIYMTEATARIGKMMMDDLVCMHREFSEFYGGVEEGSFPRWMKEEELQLLPSVLKEVVLGKDGEELGAWLPLYSAADVDDCIKKIHTLRYAEEVCYNGTLVLKAFSSGLEVGSCNWTINGPKRDVTYISNSLFASSHAMGFDYRGLQGNDFVLYSDFSPLIDMEDVDDDRKNSLNSTHNLPSLSTNNSNLKGLPNLLHETDESIVEMEKIAFVCSCVIESVKSGGSVLIPISRFGTTLQLIEQISSFLDYSSLKVPIYMISSIAEELLAFANVIPEWLCKERQEKLFSGEPMFEHVKLQREEKLHVFGAIHSNKLLTNWQEPCIVFCPHWSLRLGPIVHLLRRWCGDHNSLLVLEKGVDAELALLPFRPMEMKVLQCEYLSGIKFQNVQPLLKILQPKVVLLPKDLSKQIGSDLNPFYVLPYSENETLRIPMLRDCSELEAISTDLVSNFPWKKLKQGNNMNITRLRGELLINHGKYQLFSKNDDNKLDLIARSRIVQFWGTPDLEKLLRVLLNMGIKGSVEKGKNDTDSENACLVSADPYKPFLLESQEMVTVICASNKDLATLIFNAMYGVLEAV